MFPHEKTLVKRHADQPFAIVGVNSDQDRDSVQELNTKAGITWRSFWNGPKSTTGPISTRWNVRSWPTLYLIDHQGVIRKRWIGSPPARELDASIAELIEKARS